MDTNKSQRAHCIKSIMSCEIVLYTRHRVKITDKKCSIIRPYYNDGRTGKLN